MIVLLIKYSYCSCQSYHKNELKKEKKKTERFQCCARIWTIWCSASRVLT